MVGWYRWLNGHEFEQTPRDSEGQGAWHAIAHGVTKTQQLNNDIYEAIYETETEFTDVENKLLVTKGEEREG